MAHMISKWLGQTGQQPDVCSTLGHCRSESICQSLQNIFWPRPNSKLSIEMSTYRQSFPSFAALNDDNPAGLFPGATFQNCTFTFGSLCTYYVRIMYVLCGMNSVSDLSSSSTSWKSALLDSTPPCGKFQKETNIFLSEIVVMMTIELWTQVIFVRILSCLYYFYEKQPHSLNKVLPGLTLLAQAL